MDMGCGLGLVDVMVWNGLSEPRTCYLVDKSDVQENKRLVGFGDSGSFGFYSSLEKTRDVMKANGVSGAVVLEPESVGDTVPAGTLDVVISRISWCFHYPYQTYADLCHSLLRAGGTLIVDCRKKHVKELKNDPRYRWTCVHETQKAYVMKGVKI
eukprot:jgi/Tetstr1/464148/TSEL_008953.t1